MSFIEEIGELSLVCAGLKAENAALKELVKDASTLLVSFHSAMEQVYGGKSSIARAPIVPVIEAWQARAATVLNETPSQQAKAEPEP